LPTAELPNGSRASGCLASSVVQAFGGSPSRKADEADSH
jgi:hypothetical protein